MLSFLLFDLDTWRLFFFLFFRLVLVTYLVIVPSVNLHLLSGLGLVLIIFLRYHLRQDSIKDIFYAIVRKS